MTAFLFAAVNHRECEERSKLSEMTTFQAVPWCPAADTHMWECHDGAVCHVSACVICLEDRQGIISGFSQDHPPWPLWFGPSEAKVFLAMATLGSHLSQNKPLLFFLSYWKCPKRLTDLKGKQILISHICNLSPSPEFGQQVAAESRLSCPNRSHLRCTPRPLVTVHNSNRPSSLSL